MQYKIDAGSIKSSATSNIQKLQYYKPYLLSHQQRWETDDVEADDNTVSIMVTDSTSVDS